MNHDTHQLRTHFSISGIKAVPDGISGCKQVIKFAHTSNCGGVCLFLQS